MEASPLVGGASAACQGAAATMDDMTEPGAYPGYATPTFVARGTQWHVVASPWGEEAGTVEPNLPTGWTAWTPRRMYVGLFPDKQAGGEGLIKHAGYEVLGD